MNPTDFPQANHTFHRPASMTDEECGPLRVHAAVGGDGVPFSVSRWELTPEERRAVAAGAPVWLWVFGRGHMPVTLSAEPPWPEEAAPATSEPPPEERLRALEEKLRTALNGAAPSAGHDLADEVIGLLRVARQQRDDAWRRAGPAAEGLGAPAAAAAAPSPSPELAPVGTGSCPTCGACPGGATCCCNDVRCPCWKVRSSPAPGPGSAALGG